MVAAEVFRRRRRRHLGRSSLSFPHPLHLLRRPNSLQLLRDRESIKGQVHEGKVQPPDLP